MAQIVQGIRFTGHRANCTWVAALLQLFAVAVLTGSVVGVPMRAAATVSLSGTISYSGSLGPVSNARPIRMSLYFNPQFIGAPLDTATITTNGGTFALSAPDAGTYYLLYGLDVNDDGAFSVGEPFALSNNNVVPPPQPVRLPQSGVAIDFNDTGIISGFAGTVTYTGSLGPVSATRSICVCPFLDPGLTEDLGCVPAATNGARYDIVTFDTKTYYLLTFLDLNNNIVLDPGEPYVIYNNKGAPPADPIVAGPSQTAINVTFGDENLPSPTPTHTARASHTPTATRTQTATRTETRTRTPTRTPSPGKTASGMPTPTSTPTRTISPTPLGGQCAGDCDGSGQVTVDELLTLAAIALGNAPVAECTAGDAGHDGQIAVHEVLAAVRSALDGCPTSAAQPARP